MIENDPTYSLNSIYIYLTDRCNLKCRHCWIEPTYDKTHGSKESEVDIKYLKSTVSDAKSIGLSHVKLTGGEPFLRNDILDLIDFLHLHDITIDIETNGTFLNKDIVEKLMGNSVNQVSISLDGASDKQHESMRGVAGCYQEALNGLSLLSESGITTQIIMSLYDGNAADIGKLADIASEMSIGSLKINPIMPTGRARDLFGSRDNLSVEKLIDIDRWIEEDLAPKYDMAICFDIPTALKSLESITSSQAQECHIFNIIGILSNGNISLCGIGQTETELVMGNIARDDIRTVWSNHPLLQRLRKDLPKGLEGICSRCIFKFRCLGACRASAYSQTGNLFSPFFICDEAYKSGLFPESRMIDPDPDKSEPNSPLAPVFAKATPRKKAQRRKEAKAYHFSHNDDMTDLSQT